MTMPSPLPSVARQILVVDDDQLTQQAYKEVLSCSGFTVLVAGTAKEARQRVAEHLVEAIILDLNLPDGDGLELAAELLHRGVDAPVLMVSGFATPQIRARGCDVGIGEWLDKPIDSQELIAKVRLALRVHDARRLTRAGVTVDLLLRRAWRGSRALSLTAKGFDLLFFLVRTSGRPIRLDEIAREVWGHATQLKTDTYRKYLQLLRDELELGGEPPLLNKDPTGHWRFGKE